MSPLSSPKVDIGIGCRFRQSSFLEPGHEADYLMPSTLPGGFFFCTNLEHRPWLIVDLGAPRVVAEIILWNREEVGEVVVERACPLLIEVSHDAETWTVAARTTQLFGGRLSQGQLTIGFPRGQAARHIRITVEKATHFHLDYIEVIQFVPILAFGRAVSIIKGEDNVVSCEYFHQANNGLFSGYTTVLHDIICLAKAEIAVRRIDLSMSFSYFKDRTNLNAYDLFFERLPRTFLDCCRGVEFQCNDVHRSYRDMQLDALGAIADSAFRPSLAVRTRAASLLRSVNIDPNNTIAVVYRGTDKSSELTLASISEYIAATRMIKDIFPDHQILIQTDQEQARSAFKDSFGEECKYFESLPVTDNKTVIHLQLAKVSNSSRQRFAEDVMAAIQAVSQCHVVLTHTGNVGAWIAIYRGASKRLYQFDATGTLLYPAKQPNSQQSQEQEFT